MARFGGKVVALIGDGASNITYSWIFAAARLGFEVRVAAPKGYQPAPEILLRAGARRHCGARMTFQAAAKGADLLYTDVWVSMGKEAEAAERIKKFAHLPDQRKVGEARENRRAGDALPARYKGKEIDEAIFEAHAKTIFEWRGKPVARAEGGTGVGGGLSAEFGVRIAELEMVVKGSNSFLV